MKARDIVGKTIANVDQPYADTNVGRMRVLHRLTFTDGTAMMFTVIEGEGDYSIEGIYPARVKDRDA